MFKVISKEEHTILKSKSDLNMSDLEWVLWEKTSIINYLRNIQTSYRMRLANLDAVGKEWEVYIAIKTVEEVIKAIEWLKDEIEVIKKQEKEKKL